MIHIPIYKLKGEIRLKCSVFLCLQSLEKIKTAHNCFLFHITIIISNG